MQWLMIASGILVGLILLITLVDIPEDNTSARGDSASESSDRAAVAPEPTRTATPMPKPTPTPAPTQSIALSDFTKQSAIDGIQEYRLVRDAAITQEGHDLFLAIVVNPATNEQYARELGDNFVRMVKALSQDDPPGREIGKGIYDYRVGVFYPDQTQLALGAKVRFSPTITW